MRPHTSCRKILMSKAPSDRDDHDGNGRCESEPMCMRGAAEAGPSWATSTVFYDGTQPPSPRLHGRIEYVCRGREAIDVLDHETPTCTETPNSRGCRRRKRRSGWCLVKNSAKAPRDRAMATFIRISEAHFIDLTSSKNRKISTESAG